MDEWIYTNLEKINWLIDRQKYPLAEKMALELIASNPTFCYAYFALGRAYLNQNKFDEAKVILQQVVEISPDFAHTYYLFAFLYFRLNKLQDALTAIEKALQIEPENTSYQYQKGLILYNFSRFSEAKIICENILLIDSEEVKTMTLLATCLSILGETSKAEAIFDNIQKNHPNYAGLYAQKGVLEMRKRNKAEAIRLFKEALRLNPESPSVIHNLNLLEKKKKYSFSRKHSSTIDDPNSIEEKEDYSSWMKSPNTIRNLNLSEKQKGYSSWMKEEREQFYKLSYLFAFLMIFLGFEEENIYLALAVLLGVWALPPLLFVAFIIFTPIKAEIRRSRTSFRDSKFEQVIFGCGMSLSALVYFLGKEAYLLAIVGVNTILLVFSISNYSYSLKERLYKGKVGFPIALHFSLILGLWFFAALKEFNMTTMAIYGYATLFTIGISYYFLVKKS